MKSFIYTQAMRDAEHWLHEDTRTTVGKRYELILWRYVADAIVFRDDVGGVWFLSRKQYCAEHKGIRARLRFLFASERNRFD